MYFNECSETIRLILASLESYNNTQQHSKRKDKVSLEYVTAAFVSDVTEPAKICIVGRGFCKSILYGNQHSVK